MNEPRKFLDKLRDALNGRTRYVFPLPRIIVDDAQEAFEKAYGPELPWAHTFAIHPDFTGWVTALSAEEEA